MYNFKASNLFFEIKNIYAKLVKAEIDSYESLSIACSIACSKYYCAFSNNP
jgi:hypothetical protein